MEKQKTVVRVAGKEYALVSSDPPAYMQRVAAYVDRKLQRNGRGQPFALQYGVRAGMPEHGRRAHEEPR